MKAFNVIIYDCNAKEFKSYNIVPYFIQEYNEAEIKPKTFEEFREFIKGWSAYRFWSRCEYEIILVDWPDQTVNERWDIHKQIMMNIDIVTKVVMENIL